jgi:hypothetical protein
MALEDRLVWFTRHWLLFRSGGPDVKKPETAAGFGLVVCVVT